MLFLGFISGKRIQFPRKCAKTSKNPGSLASTQDYVSDKSAEVFNNEFVSEESAALSGGGGAAATAEAAEEVGCVWGVCSREWPK